MYEQSVVVVAQPDQVIFRFGPAYLGEDVNSCVDRSKLTKIVGRGEQLIQQVAGLNPVHGAALEIPAKLEVVVSFYLVEVGASRPVLRLEKQGREACPEPYLAQIAGQLSSRQAAEHIEQRSSGTGRRLSCFLDEWFRAVLEICVEE